MSATMIPGVPTDGLKPSDLLWASLLDKPLLFPPSAHSHGSGDLPGNIAFKDQANTFTANQTVTGTITATGTGTFNKVVIAANQQIESPAGTTRLSFDNGGATRISAGGGYLYITGTAPIITTPGAEPLRLGANGSAFVIIGQTGDFTAYGTGTHTFGNVNTVTMTAGALTANAGIHAITYGFSAGGNPALAYGTAAFRTANDWRIVDNGYLEINQGGAASVVSIRSDGLTASGNILIEWVNGQDRFFGQWYQSGPNYRLGMRTRADNRSTDLHSFTPVGDPVGFVTISTGTVDTPAERLRVTNGGNVLIGSTNDNGARLQVTGAVTASGNVITPALQLTTGTVNGTTTFTDDGAYYAKIAMGTAHRFTFSPEMFTGYFYSTEAKPRWGFRPYGTNEIGHGLVFNNSFYQVSISGDYQECLNVRNLAGGYTGINVGIVTASGTGTHTFGTTNTVTMTAGVLKTTGNVGVGVTPTVRFHAVDGTGVLKFRDASQDTLYVAGTNATLNIDSTAGIYPGIFVKVAGVCHFAFGNIDGGAGMGLWGHPYGGTAGMFILPSGKIGMGTITPAEILDVVGNIKVSGAITASGTGTHTFGTTNTVTMTDGVVVITAPAIAAASISTAKILKIGTTLTNAMHIGGLDGTPNYGMFIQNSNSTYPLILQPANGRVLIGKTADDGAYALQVGGGITASGVITAPSASAHVFGTTATVKLENGQLTAEDVGGQSIKLTGPNILGRYSGDTSGFYRFWIAQGIDGWGMSGNESGILLGSSDGGNLRACIKTKLGGLSFCTDGTTNANAVERFLIATGGAITASGNFSATGHVTSVIQSLSTDPTGSDLASGQTRTIKNTSTGTTKVWLNDGGAFKSLTFV